MMSNRETGALLIVCIVIGVLVFYAGYVQYQRDWLYQNCVALRSMHNESISFPTYDDAYWFMNGILVEYGALSVQGRVQYHVDWNITERNNPSYPFVLTYNVTRIGAWSLYN